MGLPLLSKRSAVPSTFTAIFRAHFHDVARWTRWFGAPLREAEDIAQLVFLALHRAITEKRYTFDAPPGPWLRAATFRITRDHVRALSRCDEPTVLQGELEPMETRTDAEGNAQVTEQWELLFKLLDGLPCDLRAVFVLHELEGLLLPEIAEDLKIPVTTARFRLRVAREELDAALRRRRAEDQRKYGAGALVLPLGLEAIVRHIRSLPQLETSPGAEARVWSRVQKEIGLSAPAPPRVGRSRGRTLRPKMDRFILAGLAFAAGVMVGAIGLDLGRRLTPPPPRPREHAPILVAAPPVEDSVLAATMPEPEPDPDGMSTATPVAPRAPADPAADAAAERRCLHKASGLLTAGDPRAALTELARCEYRFPVTHFPGARDQIRRDAEAELSRTR